MKSSRITSYWCRCTRFVIGSDYFFFELKIIFRFCYGLKKTLKKPRYNKLATTLIRVLPTTNISSNLQSKSYVIEIT